MTIDESGSILSDISYDKTDDSLVSISLLQVRTWMYGGKNPLILKPFFFFTLFLSLCFKGADITEQNKTGHKG